MTQEEKMLLLRDLCARLPFGVKIQGNVYEDILDNDGEETGEVKEEIITFNLYIIGKDSIMCNGRWISLESCKPYLRPMSSMTEEEKKDLLVTIVGNEGSKYFRVLQDGSIDNTDETIQNLNKFNIHWVNFDKDTVTLYLDWLNAHYFDYRGLIEKNLALDCTGLHIYD